MAGTGVREGSVLFQGVNRSTVAFKLMKQMGWEEGEGLGANKQGIKSHVRATKKADVTAGVGLVEARKMASDWTRHTSEYDKLLKSLKSVYENPGPAAGAKGASDDDDSDSDSDISEEKGVVEASKKSSEEEVIVETTKKITRPQGRYKRREAGKAVKSYSFTDLAAILGGGGVNPPKKEEVNLPKKEEVKPLKEEPKSDVKERGAAIVKTRDNLSSGASTSRGEAELPKSSRTPKPLRVVRVVDASVKSLEEESDLPSVGDWWGSKFGFVQAGTLVGSSEMDNERANRDERDGKSSSKDQIQISMFQEEDQERLYKIVQDKATTGKMGLGRSSMPKKVAGARWTGKKMQFCSDDEEDEDDDDDMDTDNCLPNGGCGGTATETAAGPKGDDAPSVAEEPCEDADANCVKKNVVQSLQTDDGEQAEKSTGVLEESAPRKEKAGKRKKKKKERGGEMQEEAVRASPEPSSSCEQPSVEDPAEDGTQKKRSTLIPMIAERTDRSRDMGAGAGAGEANGKREVVGGIVENGLMEEAEGLGTLGDRRNRGNRRRKGAVDDSRMTEDSGKEEACESLGCGDGDEVAGKSKDGREKKRRKKLKEPSPVAGSSEAVAKEAAAADGKLLSNERHDDPSSSLNNVACQTRARARKGIEKVEEVGGREREGARDDADADEYNHASSPNADGEPDMWSENLDKALKRVKWKRLTADVLQKALSEGVKLRVLERTVRRAVRAMDPGIDETKLQSVYRRKLQESSRFAVFGKRVFIAECEPVP